jgi:membrane associated rhomboid family serine protease
MLPIFRQIKIFSKAVVITVGSFYILNFLLDGWFNELFALNPSKMLINFEYWRLFTFPFAFSSTEALFLFLATFFLISENLEDILRQTLYPLLLMLLTVLQGVIMTLLFWNKDVNIAGMEGLSFFVLFFFVILNPKSKVQIFNFKAIPSIAIVLFIVFIWAIVKIQALFFNSSTDVNISVASAIFGISTAIMTSLQIKIIQKNREKRLLKATENLKIPKPEELSYALYSGKKLFKYEQENKYSSPVTDFEESLLSDNPDENEDKLNNILDKINAQGKNSLDYSELKFLEEYSNNI